MTINDQAGQAEYMEHGIGSDEKAHSFRKRRLSLTARNSETASSLASANEEHDSEANGYKRHRKASGASASSLGSTSTVGCGGNTLKSITLHAAELLAQPPPSPNPTLPKLYQQAAPPQQIPLIDESKHTTKSPKWKKRHTRQHGEDDKNFPFPRDIVGTFSCHGVEPIEPVYEDSDFYQNSVDEDSDTGHCHFPQTEKLTMAAKINQDRGGVAFPYGNDSRTALFAVYDGHGASGELVSQYCLHEIQNRLEKHPDFIQDIENAFKDTFIQVDSSLKDERLIEPLYAGTTACVALLRGKKLVLSNAGDSRAVLARKYEIRGEDSWEVIDLTEDQNPDLPAEQERIEKMGGFVSPPPEPGAYN